MTEHEVIIVGGGPAGSGCAKVLVDEGIDVLVIEKKELPRYKTCSGVLFGQTQFLLEKYFGEMPPKDIYCKPEIINAENVREWSREEGYKRFIWEIDKDGQSFSNDYHNVWRNKFDFWLLQQSGADYLEKCALENFELENGHVKIKIRKSSTSTGCDDGEMKCRYLVGADGGTSRVRKILDPTWGRQDADAATIHIFQGYYQIEDIGSLNDKGWTVFFEPGIGEMLTCVHRKDDQLVLCVGGFTGRNLTDSMETLEAFLAENFQVKLGKQERHEGCYLSLPTPCLGEGRVILAGEAAGQMYLNGEGISAAIDGGYRAGKAIIRGIRDNVDVINVYQETSADIQGHVRTCLEQIHFLSVQP